MNQIFINILAFMVAIGLLVTFHELGHFWVARRLGVKVLRFSVGFGKPLFSWRDKQDTEYVIAAIPLGGYVKMCDEREGPIDPQDLAYAFNRKSVWARFAIVFAGPAFNFIFAILAYWMMFIIGISGVIPMIGQITPGSIADQAGLKARQEIVAIDEVATPTWGQVAKQIVTRLGEGDSLIIRAKAPEQDEEKLYTLDLNTWKPQGDQPDLLSSLGITPYLPPIAALIDVVLPGEAGERAGMRANDRIVAINEQKVDDWQQVMRVIKESADQTLSLIVLRDNKELSLTLSPRAKKSEGGETIGFAGLQVKTPPLPSTMVRKEQWGITAAFLAAVHKTIEYTALSFKMIGKLIVGQIGIKTLSGPVSMAQGAGASAVIGIQYYLGFLALISISLGVLNLLPIPILDGGHLLYYVIEMVTGKPVSQKVQLYGFKAGLFFLSILTFIALYNDLIRLF